MPKDKVILAMSGGVDSSVAAALLKERGCDVTGVFICLGKAGDRAGESRGCCSPADAADARRVADRLDIPLFVIDLAGEFAPIVEYFLDEYARGRTPNPCIHCNSAIKFGRLMRYADSLGAKYVATGHYARIVQDCIARDNCGAGFQPAQIARARAIQKDQSYALFAIARENLGRMLLPIGECDNKARVRQIAGELGLVTHDKPDSQEICFVADDDYVALLRARRPDALRPGRFVDSSGKVLGRHEGYGAFTVGQRHGIRLGGLKEPYYVIRIDPAASDVVVGPRSETLSRRLRASAANWHCDIRAGESFTATVQIRYNHRGALGRVTLTGPADFEVEFEEPVSAITPGQAAVIYEGDRLLGGGWID